MGVPVISEFLQDFHDLPEHLKEIINGIRSKNSDALESCGICGKEVVFNSIYRSLCADGHNIPRCAQTLKQCIGAGYGRCSWCRCFVTKQNYVNSNACPLCD